MRVYNTVFFNLNCSFLFLFCVQLDYYTIHIDRFLKCLILDLFHRFVLI